jgi:threonyl-tRNA synthetase
MRKDVKFNIFSPFQDNMFSFDVEKEKMALKPMNCPGHW